MSIAQRVFRRFLPLLLAGAVWMAGTAQAQTPTAPAFRYGEAPLLDPASTEVTSYYGSTSAHTDGYAAGRSEEIKALAKALKYDPALIYEYVRDNVDIHPTFGLSKGALGAHLDKSGTVFDQAHLLFDLLDEARLNGAAISSLQYQYGTVSLTSTAEITGWLGESDAAAVCRLLGNGGVPGNVNGSTNCAGLSGSATSALVAHVWVTATVSGNPVTYDPSYKTYETIAPLEVAGQDYRDAMGANCGNGQALTAGAPAQTGTTSGSPFAKSFNESGLKAYLNQCATALWNWLETNRPEASVEEIVGGRRIVPMAPSVTGLPAMRYAASATWTQIPDPFRTKVTVDITYPFSPNVLVVDLYADEIYGKRVALNPSGFYNPNSPAGQDVSDLPASTLQCSWTAPYQWVVRLTINDQAVPGVGFHGPCAPHQRGVEGTIRIDAPYAASGGTYLDSEYMNSMTITTRAVVAFAAGRSSSAWSQHYTKALGLDRPSVYFWRMEGGFNGGPEYEPPAQVQTGTRVAENMRFHTFAAWAEQFARLGSLAGRIFETELQHHFSFGWSYGSTKVNLWSSGGGGEWTIRSDATVLSLESAVSSPLTGSAAHPVRRSFANVSAALEASTMEQQLDSTAPGGTAHKFRWGNLATRTDPVEMPVHYGTDPQGAFPIYHFDQGTDLSILTSDGIVDCSPGFSCMENVLVQSIQAYLNDGYKVIAVGDAFLGPGLRCGTTYTTQGYSRFFGALTFYHCYRNVARGGAFIAYKPDYSDIAHISFTDGRATKGGATGPTAPDELRALKTPTAADLLKEQESNSWSHNVDPKTGNLTYSSGALISAGGAEFPYSLNFQRSFTSGGRGLTDPLWGHNWDMTLTISGSGNEMLGASRGLFTAPTIATLVVLKGAFESTASTPLDLIRQESIGALAAAWWSDRLTHNVVSAAVGGQTSQFVRKLETQEFYPAEGGAARLQQSGTRYLGIPPGPPVDYLTSLAWRLDNVSFALTNPGQDQISFAFWRSFYTDPWETPYAPTGETGAKEGFHATSWTFPYGVTINLTYAFDACPDGWTGPCTLPRLTSVSNGLGRTLSFTGSVSKPLTVANDAGQSVTLTDTQVTHSDGKITEYDVRVETVGGPKGQVAAFLDSVTGPGESAPNHLFAYDDTWRTASYTNANGQSWTYQAAGGRRASVTDPSGNTDVTYFDERGLAVRAIDKRGDVSESEYDGLGRVIETRLRHSSEIPNGYHQRTTYVYDHNGNVIEERAHAATKDWVTGESWEEFDPVTYAPIVVTRTYDSVFQSVLTETVPHKQGTANPVIAFTNVYDPVTGLPTQSTGPSGEQLDIGYNSTGLAVSTTQKLNATKDVVATFAWAATGEMTAMTVDPSGLNIVTGFQYDTKGNLTQYTDPRSNATTATYDGAGRILTIRNAANGGADYVYDTKGRLEQLKALKEGGAFAIGQITYSPTGRPLTITDPEGDVTKFTYDDHDRLKYVTDPDNRTAQFTYHPDGNVHKLRKGAGTPLEQSYKETEYGPGGRVKWVKDANGNQTSYGYGPFGRLIAVTFPDTSQELYTYDARGQMIAKTTRSGSVITFGYDDSGRQISKTGAEVDDIITSYDIGGRVIGISSENGLALTNTYDKAGRLLTVTDQASRVISYQYDAAGNRTRLTHPDGYFVDYAYDALNRMSTVTENGAFTLATATYDLRSRITAFAYGNGASVDLGYEEDDDLASLDHAFVSGGWPLAGGGTGIEYTHAYSKAGMLKSRTANQFAMLQSPETAQSISYAVNILNQYTTVTTEGQPASVTHDLNGNLRGDGVSTFTYDGENQLKTATAGTGTTALYTYDPMGRRSRKSVDGNVTNYLYDGVHVIAELDGSGSVLRRYIHGDSVDLPVAMVEGDATLGYVRSYYHTDSLGSTVAITDDTGAPVAYYTYDAYGAPYLVDPATGAQTQVAAGQPYLFTGRRFDFETGLYYYRARYYSASLGRFLQTDPIGHQDQMNLYAYVGGDPINATDPSGTDTVNCRPVGRMADIINCTRRRNNDPFDRITVNGQTFFVPHENNRRRTNEEMAYVIKELLDFVDRSNNVKSVHLDNYILSEDQAKMSHAIAAALIVARAARARTPTATIKPKIQRQMGPRGWTKRMIDDTIKRPYAKRSATNKENGNPATAYFRRDGSYVVRDNKTGEIIQISNRNDPNWVPDSTIKNPPDFK